MKFLGNTGLHISTLMNVYINAELAATCISAEALYILKGFQIRLLNGVVYEKVAKLG
jgi:hypothetical protein